MNGRGAVTKAIIVAVLLLVIVIHLAGSVLAACVFIVFVGAFLLPACALAMRLFFLRTLPPDLRLIAASALVVILAVPWFFIRKLFPFSPAIADVAVCLILTGATARFADPELTLNELKAAWQRSRFILSTLPMMFALPWVGYAARSGNEVVFHGLFAVDVGFLASVIATLRASPFLPLAAVANGGFLYYHWLYFTLPATLANFFGASIPAANALVLMNLVIAALLVHTLATVVSFFNAQIDRRTTQIAVAVVLFAPFTLYYYQKIAEWFRLGWLAMPTRNHLMLSPANSMIVFGNNTFALVLVLFAVMEVERWNRERRVVDVVLGTAAVAMVIGYSATLLFPLVLALLLWLVLGRIARPLFVLAWAVGMGVSAVALFLAIRLLMSGGTRHVGFAFDGGQFLRVVLLGLAPLWVLVFLGGRKPPNLFHGLIAASIAVPSFLYIAGNPTGHIDFSMKTGSLLAVAFAPLLAVTIDKWLIGQLTRTQVIVAIMLVVLGGIETSAYLLQFSYYRLTGSRREALALSLDYYRALVWLREHTPVRSIVAAPGGLAIHVEIPSIWIAERRAWLPSPYIAPYLTPDAGSSLPRRAALWSSFMRDPGNAAVSGVIASEADYLLVERELQSPCWTLNSRSGRWMVYRSARCAR